jgi:hypothetical protein
MGAGRIALLALLAVVGTVEARGPHHHLVLKSYDGADFDGACDGTCTFRPWDLCYGCYNDGPSCVPYERFCSPVATPFLYAVPAPRGRKRVHAVRTFIGGVGGGEEVTLKCHAAKSCMGRPTRANALIGNWLLGPPIATTSDCPAALPPAFENGLGISDGGVGFDPIDVVNPQTCTPPTCKPAWGVDVVGERFNYQFATATDGHFTLVPRDDADYEATAGSGLVPLCADAPNGQTRVTIRIGAVYRTDTDELSLVQHVQYFAMGCTSCTMTWTGTAKRATYTPSPTPLAPPLGNLGS